MTIALSAKGHCCMLEDTFLRNGEDGGWGGGQKGLNFFLYNSYLCISFC